MATISNPFLHLSVDLHELLLSPLPFVLSGQDVLLESVKIGRLATANAGVGTTELAIDLTANADPTRTQRLLRAIRFHTVDGDSTATRRIAFTLSDGDGGVSAAVSKRVFVSQ
jgi:hypothetical protein